MTAGRGRLALLVFPALALALFPEALTGRGTFFHYDTWLQNLTFRAWWFEALRSGTFATWCPGMFAGYPLFAETQTGPLYPPTFLLFLTLPATLAFSLSVGLHFAAAGAGAFLLARRFGAGTAGAVLAGATWQLSGALVAHVVHFNLLVGAAWMPWTALLATAAAAGRAPAALGLAAAIACLLLGAHPYATLMNVALAAAVLAGAAGPSPVRLARGATLLVLATALGSALAAVQLLPAGELVERSTRGDAADWSFLTFGSFPPWHLAALASPAAFGTPADGSWWGGPDWSHWAETVVWVGLAPLALAAAALVLRRDAPTRTLVAAGALFFLLMLGKYTPLYRIVAEIPVLQSTRLPARWALPFAACVAVLAGLGLDALAREPSPRRRRLALGAGAFVPVVLAALALALSAPARAPGPEIAAEGGAWAARLAALGAAARSESVRLGVALAAALASLVPLALRRPPRFAAVLPIVVTVAELGALGRGVNPVIPPEALRRAPPVAAALPDVAPRPRVFRQGIDELWGRARGAPRTDAVTPGWRGNEASYATGAWALPPNTQLLYGIDSGEGFTSLLPLAWLEWMGLDARPGATPRPDLTEAQADLLALDAVLSSGSGIAGEGWDPSPLPGGLWVSRHADPLPRVRLARSWETVPGRAELLARVRADDHDPRRAVLLESAPPGRPASRSGGRVDEPLPARELAPGAWEIDVPAGTDGLVVVSESHDPGWVAEDAGGERLPVLRAEGLFLAFPAPAAGGAVRLEHAPRAVRTGAIVSVAALLVAGVLALLARGRALPVVAAPGRAASAGAVLGPALVAALVLAGSLAANAGDWRGDRARSSLAAAAARAWTEEAFAAWRGGAPDAAARLLRRAGAILPEDAGIAYRLGLAERAAGRPDAARSAFERALAIEPGHPGATGALEAPGAGPP